MKKLGLYEFDLLPLETKNEIYRKLKVYDVVNVKYAYGKYEVSPNYYLLAKYAPDYKSLGEISADDIYTPEQRDINYYESFGYMPYPSYTQRLDNTY